jgi:hypothetical protein
MLHTYFFICAPRHVILAIVSVVEGEKTKMCDLIEREGLLSSGQTVSYKQIVNLGNTIQLC